MPFISDFTLITKEKSIKIVIPQARTTNKISTYSVLGLVIYKKNTDKESIFQFTKEKVINGEQKYKKFLRSPLFQLVYHPDRGYPPDCGISWPSKNYKNKSD